MKARPFSLNFVEQPCYVEELEGDEALRMWNAAVKSLEVQGLRELLTVSDGKSALSYTVEGGKP